MSVFSKKKEPPVPIVNETAPVVVKVYVHFASVPRTLLDSTPDLVERTVVALFESDANRLANLAYVPVATAWLPTMSSSGVVLRASLTVTYVRQP